MLWNSCGAFCQESGLLVRIQVGRYRALFGAHSLRTSGYVLGHHAMSQRPGTRHPTRPAVLTVLATVVICITHLRPFASARVDAFIGYSEKAADCTDQLPDCLERSRGNGCLFDVSAATHKLHRATAPAPPLLAPSRTLSAAFASLQAFKMRKHCPATCAVPRCASQGSKQVDTSSPTQTFTARAEPAARVQTCIHPARHKPYRARTGRTPHTGVRSTQAAGHDLTS